MKQLEEALKRGKLIFGFKEVSKSLRKGEINKVIMASNIPKDLKNEIEWLSKVFNVELNQVELTSLELGMKCGKPFPISVLAIR